MDRRCLLITYYFPPTGGGGVQRVTKWVKYASQSGWQFTVITAEENVNTIERDASLLKEIPASTQIIRIPFTFLAQTSKNSRSTYVKRWLSALFFIPDSRKKWVQQAWPVIAQQLQKQKFDLILISLPPYSLAYLIKPLKQKFDVPVGVDLRDPWTLNPYKIHPTPVHRWLDWRIEKKSLEQTDFGISAYQRLLNYYKSKLSRFEENRWLYLPNGFDEEDFKTITNKVDPLFAKNTFNIGFSGTIYSHLNHPTPLFKALKILKQNWPNQAAKIQFVHVGKAHINLKKLAVKYGLHKQVHSIGYLPHQQALSKLNQMEALCFILDDKNRRSSFTIGGKVYEYLRLKKPILALVPPQGEAADLIRQTNSGVVISPQNTAKIASTLKNWLQAKPSFRFTNIELFERKYQVQQLIQFFEKILSNFK